MESDFSLMPAQDPDDLVDMPEEAGVAVINRGARETIVYFSRFK